MALNNNHSLNLTFTSTDSIFKCQIAVILNYKSEIWEIKYVSKRAPTYIIIIYLKGCKSPEEDNEVEDEEEFDLSLLEITSPETADETDDGLGKHYNYLPFWTNLHIWNIEIWKTHILEYSCNPR